VSLRDERNYLHALALAQWRHGLLARHYGDHETRTSILSLKIEGFFERQSVPARPRAVPKSRTLHRKPLPMTLMGYAVQKSGA
jgi:hypothetical protein